MSPVRIVSFKFNHAWIETHPVVDPLCPRCGHVVIQAGNLDIRDEICRVFECLSVVQPSTSSIRNATQLVTQNGYLNESVDKSSTGIDPP
jgi:hypothetical protein